MPKIRRIPAFAGITMALLRPHKGMKMDPAPPFVLSLSKHERREEGVALLPVTSAVHPSTLLRANGRLAIFMVMTEVGFPYASGLAASLRTAAFLG